MPPPKQQTHVGVVRQWLQSLGVLSAISISRQEAEMKLAAFAPMLKERFPDAAFNSASLEHVAFLARKGFPTYAELAEWLSQWCREHRPQGPPRLTVDGSNEMAKLRERERAVAESWDDPAGILQRVRDCGGNVMLLRCLGAAVRRWAPQHEGYIPPHILEILDRDPDEFRGFDRAPLPSVGARLLTPAQLDQVNPLPDGRKRDHAAWEATQRAEAAADTGPAATVDEWHIDHSA